MQCIRFFLLLLGLTLAINTASSQAIEIGSVTIDDTTFDVGGRTYTVPGVGSLRTGDSFDYYQANFEARNLSNKDLYFNIGLNAIFGFSGPFRRPFRFILWQCALIDFNEDGAAFVRSNYSDDLIINVKTDIYSVGILPEINEPIYFSDTNAEATSLAIEHGNTDLDISFFLSPGDVFAINYHARVFSPIPSTYLLFGSCLIGLGIFRLKLKRTD